MVQDEFHTIIAANGRSTDAYFLDRSREFRCMCIMATQGISAISSVVQNSAIRDHLLNNCRTKFFFSNDCPQTTSYFESLGGDEEHEVASTRFERIPPPPRFRLPNHTFSEPPRMGQAGVAIDIRKKNRFCGAELGALPNGTALVVSKGRTLSRYQVNPVHYASSPTSEPSAK